MKTDKLLMVLDPKVCVAVVCMGLVSTASATPVQWSVASGGNDHWYDLVTDVLTWEDAQTAAASRGGYLATVTSDPENNFIVDEFFGPPPASGGDGFWLGGIQPPGSPEPAGNWTWANGDPWTYDNWNPGEPNNDAGGEDALEIHRAQTNHGGWNDTKREYTKIGYFVEYDSAPIPEPLTMIGLALGVGGVAGYVRRRCKRIIGSGSGHRVVSRRG